MPRSKKVTLRRRTKSYKKTKAKSYKKTKAKSHSKEKLIINSQYKTIEFPDYNSKSDLVGADMRNKVIHEAYMKNVNLSHAKLHGTKFVDCTFIRVNFDHAFMDTHTEFVGCKFINCKTDSIKYVNGALKAKFDTAFSTSYA
jgi:uncharacterized protein YjbI with pentapeptide repeats